MSDVSIKIVNGPQVQRAFNKAPNLMRRALTDATNRSLLLIGGKAASNAPVRTGNLRSSILDPSRGLELSRESVFLSGSVGSGTGYGAFVERGTRFQRAQPYLVPAVTSSKMEVNKIFALAVNSVLNDIGRST